MTTVVLYHGSHTDLHGVYTVEDECRCNECRREYDQWEASDVEWGAPEPVRWVLRQAYPSTSPWTLAHVRPESFTPIQP